MDVLLARAMAKDKMHRFASGVEFGDAIQKALRLPPSDGWEAQKRLAQKAKAISEMMPAAVAPARALEAERLRTDAMTAFKR